MSRKTATSSQSTIYTPKPVVHPWDGTAFPWDGNQIPWDGNQIPWDGSAAARPAPAAATHASPPLPHLKGPKRIVAIFRSFNALTNSAQNGRQKESTCFPPKAGRPSQPCPPDASPLRSSRSTPATRGTARKNEQTSATACAASTPARPNHAGSRKMRGMKNKP